MLIGQERCKYEKAWALDKYREYSPGEHLVDRAIADLEMTAAEGVIDFGCGTGRAAKLFQDKGFIVLGFDIASNCLEVDIPFVEAVLWDLPEFKSDWGFCTDVMEHIPTEMVPRVLQQIHLATYSGVFFQIALTKDAFGDRIGERLHLTVKPPEWWHEQLSNYWATKLNAKSNTAIAVCKPKN